jgi:hypothetical protein
MLIEEAIDITAPLSQVWDVFMDLTCWADWNTILTNVSSPEAGLTEGRIFSCSIRPYAFPINFQPRVVEIIPKKKIVWTGRKYGITSHHEYFFEETAGGVIIRSRERFSGLPLLIGGFLFPKQKIRLLNTLFLNDLKRAAEASA